MITPEPGDEAAGMEKILKKFTDHFEGSRKMAILVLLLFAAGILIFIVNNTVLFFVDEKEYFWPRLCMKGLTDLCWVAASMLGTRYYPTKRNELLMPTLVFYMLGDIAVFFSVPVGGLLYAIGHVFMLLAIIETTYIRIWQVRLYIVFILIPAAVMLICYDDVFLITVGILYGLIVTGVLAFSLSNRFFWLAGIVFTASDLTGALRLSLLNNKYTYVVTTAIYFAAFFMLCISVYSTNRKEVVTMNDLFRMLNDTKSKNVSFWVCGHWALGLIKGDRKYSYDHIDLAYDIDRVDEFLMWMKHARYDRKHKYAEGTRVFYSEKYGELRIFPCLFRPDGSAVLTIANGHQLELDDGFFEEVSVFGKTIPCIAPGGQELIRKVLK